MMLIARNISKKFSGVTALNAVNLQLTPGKVTAIIGENGAGKSTLMKILSGVHQQYEGDILLDGKLVKFSNTKEAEEAGIAIIHQELNLIPYLSIAENIFLGREITGWLDMVDSQRMKAITKDLLSQLHLDLDPDTKIAELKVGQQQLVEIAKALYTDAAVIIMDEPTSAISDKEVEHLFGIIRQLKSKQKTIAYISHKLNELFIIADRFVVLRDGETVDAGDLADTAQDELIQKMTGRKLDMEKRGRTLEIREELLSVQKLSLRHPVLKQKNLLEDISFTLHKGEILGIYGLMGAGRTELLETIFGLHPRLSRQVIKVNQEVCTIHQPSDAIRHGIALVPEDRKLQGLILNQNIQSNISLSVLKKLEKWGIYLLQKSEALLANQYINSLSIKTSSDKNLVKNLSGGNQQKIVLAKWLATHPQILLLDEPTRGIDIHAKSEIYKLMKELASQGIGIVMASSELPEILAVSDRVMVLCEGSLTATIPIEDATETDILKYAIQKKEQLYESIQ